MPSTVLVHAHCVFNPLIKSGNASIDSRLVVPGASDSPRHDAKNSPFAVNLFHQRSTGITLTGVDAAAKFPGADHGTEDLVVVNVPLIASLIRDERHSDHLQSARRFTPGA